MGFPFNLDCGERSEVTEKIRMRLCGTVKCIHCWTILGVLINVKLEPIYAIGDFISISRVGEEFERLGRHIEQLIKDFEKKSAMPEMMSFSLVFSEFCRAKVDEAKEIGATVNSDVVKEWRFKAEECSRQISKFYTERRQWKRDGAFYPYPYVFKPPEPPGDIGVATNVQLNRPVDEEEFDVDLFCWYCGSKLSMDERFCSVCGKKS